MPMTASVANGACEGESQRTEVGGGGRLATREHKSTPSQSPRPGKERALPLSLARGQGVYFLKPLQGPKRLWGR